MTYTSITARFALCAASLLLFSDSCAAVQTVARSHGTSHLEMFEDMNSTQLVEAFKTRDQGKATLDVFYETLCPTCVFFLKTYLKQVYSYPDLAQLVDLRLFPYGNAQQSLMASGNYNIQCQHGETECTGNMVHMCAIRVLSSPFQYVPLFVCMAEQATVPIMDITTACAAHLNIDMAPITACMKTPEANLVMSSIGKLSNMLNPPRGYTPWVLVDGVHQLRAEQGYIVDELCGAVQKRGLNPQVCAYRNNPVFFRQLRGTQLTDVRANATVAPSSGPCYMDGYNPDTGVVPASA